MGRPIKAGSVDVTDYVMIRDSGDGSAETGVDVTTLDVQYVRSGVAPSAKVDVVALAATDTAHTDNRMIEIDATDQPGLYRVDWPDAAFAVGVAGVVCTVKGSGFDPVHISHELVGEDRDIIGSFTGQIQSVTADTPSAGIMRIGLSDPGLSSAANDQMNNCWLAIVDRSTREVLAGKIIGDWDNGNFYAFIDDIAFTPTTGMDYQLIFLPSAAEVSGDLPVVDAEAAETKVDEVKAVTDNLPDSGALTTIGTDTARLTAVRAAVLTDWIDNGRLDLLLDAVKVITDALTAPAAAKLALSAAGIIPGVAETGTLSTTQATTDLTGYTANQLIDRTIIFTEGPAEGEAKRITGYEVTNGRVTFVAMTVASENGDAFIIV